MNFSGSTSEMDELGNVQLSLFEEAPAPLPRITKEERLLKHLQLHGTVSGQKAISQLGFSAEELFTAVQNLRKYHIIETVLVNTDSTTQLYSYIRYLKKM